MALRLELWRGKTDLLSLVTAGALQIIVRPGCGSNEPGSPLAVTNFISLSSFAVGMRERKGGNKLFYSFSDLDLKRLGRQSIPIDCRPNLIYDAVNSRLHIG